MVRSPNVESVHVGRSRWTQAVVASALAVVMSASGCFTTIGGLAGHTWPGEKRAAAARCDRRHIAASECAMPKDHTVRGMGIGLAVDVALTLLILYSAGDSFSGPQSWGRSADPDVPNLFVQGVDSAR